MSNQGKTEATEAKLEEKSSARPRIMRLPKNSQYPNYIGLHPEDEWCAKVGCRPICNPEDPAK